MNLVGIAGRAGSGKDTVANHLVSKHGYVRYGLADPIKAMLNAGFGWQPEQWDDRAWKEAEIESLGFSPRRAAQTLGTEWGRSLNGNLWLSLAEWFITRTRVLNSFEPVPTYTGIVIPDIRFENEATWLREMGGTLWHVRRAAAARVAAHSSEAGVAILRQDWIIENGGDINDLLRAVDASSSWHLDTKTPPYLCQKQG